ncbi:MAG: metalloregulator ArsR/SmtB family transcription factor [Myxococcota bacterium]
MSVQPTPFDSVFQALANPARREVIARLGLGPTSVGDLAVGSSLALPTFVQHLRVLERAGLVRSQKRGRVRTYTLCPAALVEAEGWLVEQRARWEARLDRLDALLTREDP